MIYLKSMLRNYPFYSYKSNYKFILSTYFKKNTYKSQEAMENKPVETSIKQKLQSSLNPVYLNVINESFMHNVPKGSETHFKVIVVSKDFENMTLIKRHRLINSLLDVELKEGVHALSIVAKDPSQWNPNEEIVSSPKCLGGFGK